MGQSTWGITQRQTWELQPRRLREWVPGSSLLHIQTSTFSPTSQTPRTTTVKMAVSKIRQNYHEDCEALINKQINMVFYASYVYLSMSSYFSRDDQALPGQAWRPLCLPGYCQAGQHGVGHVPRGNGGRPRAGEDGEPEPARAHQGGGRQG